MHVSDFECSNFTRDPCQKCFQTLYCIVGPVNCGMSPDAIYQWTESQLIVSFIWKNVHREDYTRILPSWMSMPSKQSLKYNIRHLVFPLETEEKGLISIYDLKIILPNPVTYFFSKYKSMMDVLEILVCQMHRNWW